MLEKFLASYRKRYSPEYFCLEALVRDFRRKKTGLTYRQLFKACCQWHKWKNERQAYDPDRDRIDLQQMLWRLNRKLQNYFENPETEKSYRIVKIGAFKVKLEEYEK